MRGTVLVVLLGLAFVAKPAAAQVELDGSMGPTSGLVPGGTLPNGTAATYLIDESYGRRSGPNLFHSFSRFDIPAAQSAAFTGDPSIQRVVGRVTGSLPSFINGTLRNTIEGADLYLFNPLGFFFSGTSSLDLRGSLYLSSANNLRFDDDIVYSSLPVSGEVLSSAAPSAWGFTSATTPGVIFFNRVTDLRVPLGENLSAVGGPVLAIGVAGTSTLLAPGGTISLASRLSPGEVPVDVASLSARDAAAGELGTVTIGSNATLDVSDASDLAPSRGRIVIRSGALSVISSTLRSDSARESDGVAPDVDLETTQSIALRSSNLLMVATTVESAARGNARAGGVRLSSEAITLAGGSSVTTTAADTARAGPLEVDAGSLQLSELSHLATSATSDATAGRMTLNANTIGLASGAQISSVNEASTQAPALEISANELLRVESGAIVASQVRSDGPGAPIRITAGKLEQATGGAIETTTFAAGPAGGVEIVAGRVELSGNPEVADPGGVFATSLGSGAAGGIVMRADDVVVAGGAQLSATTEAAGRGGDVEIRAAGAVLITGASVAGPSGVFARSGLGPTAPADGNAGSILIVARAVNVTEGAELSTEAFGAGASGGIHIVAAEELGVAGGTAIRSSIVSKTESGEGGDIAIETTDLHVDDGAEISASTLGTGSSGDVRIDAQRVIVGGGEPGVVGPAGIFAQSLKTPDLGIGGNGGDIEIHATDSVELQRSGVISVRTNGPSDAGTIRIVAPIVIVADAGLISAQTVLPPDAGARGGAGGDIEVEAANLLELGSAGAISVRTAGLGDAGTITIRGTELVRIEDAEISARSDSGGEAGDVILTGVGELIVGEGGRITSEALGNGPGGSIAIDAVSQVLVANGGTISALSTGAGNAGSIAIQAGQRFSARNGGQVTTSAVNADGGDITIGASRLINIQAGRVTTDVRAGLGSGGNITLDPEFVVFNHAEVRASAIGNGGNITIDNQHYLKDAASVVDASSELGIDGEIRTNWPKVDLTSELVQLDTTFLDASSKLAAACAARAGERGTFAVRGRARPVAPDSPLGAPDEDARKSSCDQPKP